MNNAKLLKNTSAVLVFYKNKGIAGWGKIFLDKIYVAGGI